MSRPVLAPLAVALSALLVAPQVLADTTSPLFVVEQQRAALVIRLAKQWSGDFALLPKERRLDHEQLSSALFALRADRLFAVTLAGDTDSVEAVLGEARRDAVRARVRAKALGDATADLTYTPVNPCRILDTRSTAVGPLAPNVARTFDGYSTNFATQGGAGSGCGIPNGVAALAMNVYAVNPTNLGFIKLWPANQAEPAVSTVNYQVGITAIATGALVPVDAANSNQFTAKSPATVDFIADVVGYFKPPGDAIGLDIKVSGQRVMRYEYNAISPNLIGGSPANEVVAGVRGATIAGGGVPVNLSEPDYVDNAPNRVTDHYGTIGGGYANRVGDDNSTVNDAPFSTIGGGYSNTASGWLSTIGGGAENTAAGRSSTVAGGYFNSSNHSDATVSGGALNTAGSIGSAVGGGNVNTANGDFSTIGGGLSNRATGTFGTVGGGNSNSANGSQGTIGGGYSNTVAGGNGTIGGGQSNAASGSASTIGGGSGNAASGLGSSILGGHDNVASGWWSTVGGGWANTASGQTSLAAGRRAKTETSGSTPTMHDGAFVWADANDFDFRSTAANQFAARTTGGVRFVTAIDEGGLPTWICGVSGGAGGSWGCSSDRDLKADLIPLDGIATLERLAALPVYQWAAKDDPRRTSHAGPTAQDFMAAFGLGDNDKMIGFADAQGVAFAAIQGLNAKLEARLAAKDQEISDLKRAVELLLLRASRGGGVNPWH